MFSEVVRRIAPSVVYIVGGSASKTEANQIKISYHEGTGFLIAPNLMVTARHVVTKVKEGIFSPNPNINVFTFGSPDIHQTTIKTGEVHNALDVAILKLKEELPVSSVHLNFDEQPLGRQVGTLGYPLPPVIGGNVAGSATFEPILKFHSGYISAIVGEEKNRYTYETDTILYSGASGSPLFLSDGSVIAVGVSHRVDPKSQSALNMSQWIPLALIKDILGRNIAELSTSD